MTLERRPLAFILLRDSETGGYWLLDNNKLKGYNWVGGKVDEPEDSSPRAAALREFQEEMGQELSEWAAAQGAALPELDWERVDLDACLEDAGGTIEFPFYSDFAKVDKLGLINFFALEVADVPGLAERLAAASRIASPWGNPACVRLDIAGLARIAKANPINPFIGLVFMAFPERFPITPPM